MAGLKPTNNLQKAINFARDFQIKNRIEYLNSEILLLGILSVECHARKILNKYSINSILIRNKIEIVSQPQSVKLGDFSANTSNLLSQATEIARKTKCGFFSTEHVLLAMLWVQDTITYKILKNEITSFELFEQEVIEATAKCSEQDKDAFFLLNEIKNKKNAEIKTYKQKSFVSQQNYQTINFEETPLKGFGYDLTEKARQGKIDPVIGRDKEILRVIQTLSRRLKSCPLLIGEPGIGKSAIVEGLAQKIVDGDVPQSLFGKTVFCLDLSGMVAGASYHGEFEKRFKEAFDYVKEREEIILFIDEIHNIMGAGNGIKAPDMLKPALARGELQLIGATTIGEYRKFIEGDGALERRFQSIMIEPPSVDDCITIIQGIRDKFEAHHRVQITDEAIVAAVNLSERYITDRFLPDKAIDLIDEAAAHKRLVLSTPETEIRENEEKVKLLVAERDYLSRIGRSTKSLDEKIAKLNDQLNERYEIDLSEQLENGQSINGEDIAKIISDITLIPVSKLTESEADRLLKLESILHKRVIGQTQAVTAVSKAIRRARACVKDENRPIGSFIFVGPTGVGKTELTKALAETMFGSEKMLIRVDMSEYMEKASVSKLIGAPPGYVGYEEQGQLTEKVRRKPFSVVLFDEIEKAHPDIFNLMLQILDDGRLTDNKGRVVDFKNTIIIMTSNAGASQIKDSNSFGFGGQSVEDNAKEKMLVALRKQFKPEFLNRVDDIIVFTHLSKEECGEITKILCDKLVERLKAQNIWLTIDSSATDFILQKGYDQEYGARPLRRTVQNLIEDAISEEIIAGNIKNGDKVRAVSDGEFIRFIK